MNKTYVCTDLHGMRSLWEQIKNYCDETDTIYFLGDAADRGEDGLKLMKDLLADKRVKYLKGNHEDMLVLVGLDIFNGAFESMDLLISNGGAQTLRDFLSMEDTKEQIKLIKTLDALPLTAEYTNTKGQNIFLSHAGTAFDYTEEEIKNMVFNRYLWDRTHICREWTNDPKYENTIMVHGHTPTQILKEKLNECQQFSDKEHIKYTGKNVITYCNGHKIDLDLGSFATGFAALFDLDEMKVVNYFQV